MAESMRGMKRTCRCAELSEKNIGEEVTMMGWVQKQRNKGGIIFVDMRDRSGILQVIFEDGEINEADFAKAEKLRSEFVIAVKGKVTARSGAVNENLATGAIELRAEELRVLSESDTPPFPIEADSKTKEELRLKYRYLDLRRPDLQRNLIMRSKVATLIRQFLADEGFLEIETPMLTKSTPEGARDYLVPSRVHPGTFYAQSGAGNQALPIYCHSHHSFLSSFLCVLAMTDISSLQDVSGMRTLEQTDSLSLHRLTWSFHL